MTFNASLASNVVDSSGNPAYAVADFLEAYPQFTDNVPESRITAFITMANASIAYGRYFEQWEYAMGLYVGHHATLYLQMTAAAGATVDEALATGQNTGNLTSMKQGDVTIQIDHDAMTKGTESWGMWNATAFGRQLATLARVYGLGGSFAI
jgi:hypothetical protein